MRKIFLAAILILLLAIAAPAKSDDINFASSKKDFPEDKYFFAIGNAQDQLQARAQELATEAARGELAKSLRSTIKSSTQATRTVDETSDGAHAFANKVASTYRRSVEVQGEVSGLTNAEVKKLVFNEDSHEAKCLIILDRKAYADATRPKLAETGRLIQSFLSELGGEQKQMRRIQLLKKAMAEFQKATPIADIFDIVIPEGQPRASTVMGTTFETLLTRLYQETANLSIAIEVEGNSEIGGAITAEVNRAGFRVKRNAAIKLKINAQARIPQDRLLATAGIAMANGRVLSEIYEDGVMISSFTLNQTASAQAQTDALDRLKNAMKKQILQEYIDGFLGSF